MFEDLDLLLEDAIKTYGFGYTGEARVPKFPHPVIDRVARKHGYERTVLLHFYGIRYATEDV